MRTAKRLEQRRRRHLNTQYAMRGVTNQGHGRGIEETDEKNRAEIEHGETESRIDEGEIEAEKTTGQDTSLCEVRLPCQHMPWPRLT